jgi:hypothetical protein
MGDIMEFTESNHLFGSNVKPELPHLGNALPAKCPSIFKLNQTLDSIRIPSMFNEQTIENFLQNLEEIERTDQPEYYFAPGTMPTTANFPRPATCWSTPEKF